MVHSGVLFLSLRSDLQRKIACFCSNIDIEALLFRQYLCDVSTESQFYWLKMTAWSSAFDCGVARPLVYLKSLSLIEKVRELLRDSKTTHFQVIWAY